MTLIDSHCHLNYEGLVERQDEVLENARNRGVRGFLNISTRQREWRDIIAVAEQHDDVWASVGVHPHEADAHPDLGATALVEVCRPLPIALTTPTARSASGTRRLTSVDFPTPEWPTMTEILPARRSRSSVRSLSGFISTYGRSSSA